MLFVALDLVKSGNKLVSECIVLFKLMHFTTQTLLNSVGVSRNRSTPGAVAINWILKDGAGRVGKMLYSQQGKKIDYDLKQQLQLYQCSQGLFLPSAYAANVAKNVGAVTSTSTCTLIYKAFARGENIGDVTAKGECVGKIADLLGTGFSIMVTKGNPSLVTTFALLSCGYVFSTYQEVDLDSPWLQILSLRLISLHALSSFSCHIIANIIFSHHPSLVDICLPKQWRVPTLQEGNAMESVFNLPWSNHSPILLGSRFKDAFQDANSYLAIEPVFEANALLHIIRSSNGNRSSRRENETDP
ncbi:hypothetical protein AgCh_033607 [Apium graveolens]